MAAISAALDTPNAELARVIIHTAIELYRHNTEVRRALMQNLIALGHEGQITETMRELIAMLGERVAPSLPDHLKPVSATTIFVAAYAVEGAIRAAAYNDRILLESRAFEDELVLLVRSYLRGAAGEHAARAHAGA